MSDDVSYSSSSQDDVMESDFGEDESEFGSMSSALSELSAAGMVTHLKYSIIWELLQECQEAAIEDIPERYRKFLTIFDTDERDQEPVTFQCESDADHYDELFRAAGAIKSSEPWSLPALPRPISEEDALSPPNVQVLSVAQVVPTAAVYLTPNTDLADKFRHMSVAVASDEVTSGTKNDLQSASPLVNAKMPLFASTVFTSASQVAHHEKNPSFRTLWGYNRLATTSLLRQAHSFHIDRPIFGVLLQRNLVAFHIDWYEEREGMVVSNSAMYALDDEATYLKTWDLRNPIEAAEVRCILSNVRKYTAGPYAVEVQRGLRTTKRPFQPWKWHPSLLPEVLAYSRLQQHPEEPPEEKMHRWRKSIAESMDHTLHENWSRPKIHSGGAGPFRLRSRSRDFLSPPSTPQSLGDLHIVVNL